MKKSENKFFSKRKIVLYTIVSILVILITFGTFIYASNNIRKIVAKSSSNFLKQTASLYAGTFKIKIQDQLAMLESQSRYFKDVDMDDYYAIKKTIMSTKGVGEFKRIAVANSSGMTINYDGKTSGNILTKEYFKKAMQ